MTLKHILALIAVMNKNRPRIPPPREAETRGGAVAHRQHFTRGHISLQEGPYFKVESRISSTATPMLTKQQLVTSMLEWPVEAAGQGAAGLPREPCQEGWRRQRSPGHLCPLGCVLTTALDPEGSHPNKLSREWKGKGSTRGRRHFFF